MKILIVDDEAAVIEAVAYNLRQEGYQVFSADDAGLGLEMVRREKPDLLILDVMLPSASGLDVLRTLRKSSPLPIILLTARVGEAERIGGLEAGADDYVTKPFSMRELMARVRTVLRRARPDIGAHTAPVVSGDLRVDPDRREVTLRGEALYLAPREFDLLYFLASHPGKVFSRQALLDQVWGPDAFVGDKTVDVHVRGVRVKIEEDPAEPRHILTVRGVGYRFRAD